MHQQAYNWIKAQLATIIITGADVLEVGSLDVNSTARGLVIRPRFEGCGSYTGIDRTAGRGVDIVCDLHEYEPGILYDIIVCCECLEHDPQPGKAFHKMMAMVKPGGTLLMTCAGPGRAPHMNGHGEYYGNVTPVMLDLPPDARVERDASHHDLYVRWTRPLEG